MSRNTIHVQRFGCCHTAEGTVERCTLRTTTRPAFVFSKRTFCSSGFGRALRMQRVVSFKTRSYCCEQTRAKVIGECIKVARTDQKKVIRAGLVMPATTTATSTTRLRREVDGRVQRSYGLRRNAKYGIPVERTVPRPGQFLWRSLENQPLFSGILEKIRLSQAFPRFHVSQ